MGDVAHMQDDIGRSDLLADERFARTLQPTALVHEAYLRLVDQQSPDWESRNHFYGIAAHLMRQILVDHARARLSAKRGGDAVIIQLDNNVDVARQARSADLLGLNDALDALATRAPVQRLDTMAHR